MTIEPEQDKTYEVTGDTQKKLRSAWAFIQFDQNLRCLLYCKNHKISNTRKFVVITLKVEQDGYSLEWCIQKMQKELQTV